MIFSSVRGRNTKRFPFGNGHGNFEVPIHWMNSFYGKEALHFKNRLRGTSQLSYYCACHMYNAPHISFYMKYKLLYRILSNNNSTLLNLMNLMDFKTTKNVRMVEDKIVLHKINIQMDHKNAMSYDVHTSSFSCLHFP